MVVARGLGCCCCCVDAHFGRCLACTDRSESVQDVQAQAAALRQAVGALDSLPSTKLDATLLRHLFEMTQDVKVTRKKHTKARNSLRSVRCARQKHLALCRAEKQGRRAK